MKKRTIICFIFLLVVVMIFVFIIKSCTNYLFDENTAQRVFNNSQYELDLVADYLATYEYSDILISEANGNMNLLLSGEVKIKDENVNHAIKKLFQRGYKSISKHTSDNAIVFLKKTRFNDFGSGFAYSIDNISQPNLQYLTELKPLSHKNWYYYEEDYNEWRLQGYTGTNAVSHRVTTGSWKGADKIICKGANKVVKGQQSLLSGSRYGKGAIKKGTAIMNSGIKQMNTVRGTSSVVGSTSGGFLTSVKSFFKRLFR